MPVEQEFQSGRIRARAVVLISLLGQVAGPGCAKVGDPLPPLSHPPPTIRSLKLVQVDDRIRLHFPLASREVVQVQLFRECPEGASSSEPAMLLDRDQLRRREDGAGFLVEQQLPADGAPCGYFLRFVDTDGRISPPSNLVRASAVKAAAPPRNLRCEVHPDHLRLEWDRPQSNHDGSRPAVLVGYLVNSRHRVSTEAFRDSEFRFGRARRYSVQAISRDADPLILSRASDTLTIVPEDSFAPGAPRNVTAVYWRGRSESTGTRTAKRTWQAISCTGTWKAEPSAGFRLCCKIECSRTPRSRRARPIGTGSRPWTSQTTKARPRRRPALPSGTEGKEVA